MDPTKKKSEPVQQVKKDKRNHWTEERTLILAALWEQGVSYEDMSKETGMSKSAIQTYVSTHLTAKGVWLPFEPRKKNNVNISNAKNKINIRKNSNIRDIEDVYNDKDIDKERYWSDPDKVPFRGKWNKRKSLDACLWHDEGVSSKEIAERTGLSQQAVQKFVRNHRVQRGLWKVWQDRRPLYLWNYTGKARKIKPSEDKTLIKTKYFEVEGDNST